MENPFNRLLLYWLFYFILSQFIPKDKNNFLSAISKLIDGYLYFVFVIFGTGWILCWLSNEFFGSR